MPKIFNISSLGSTATHWLTNFLNNENILSFHALRQDPFNLPMFILLNLFSGLINLRERMAIEKPVGVIHNFSTTSDIKPIIKIVDKDSVHFAIIRQPISRLHSQFTLKVKWFDLPEQKKFFDLWSEGGIPENIDFQGTNSVYEVLERKMAHSKSFRLSVKETFRLLFLRIIKADLDNIEHCEPSELILFETLFSDKTILPKIVSNISGISVENVNLSYVDTSKKSNSHVKKQMSEWAEFPDIFRNIAADVIESNFNRSEIIEAYNKVGYDGLAIWNASPKAKNYFLR